MDITIIGSGNVATQLALALKSEGFHLLEIASANFEHASELAERVKVEAIAHPSLINPMVDLIIIAVTDSAIPEVVKQLPATQAVIIHTAGSIDMSVLDRFVNRGVLYPFQTITKTKEVDFSHVPILIEAANTLVCDVLNHVALQLSNKVTYATSAQRKQLHLAAVFANNFVNHMYAIAYDLMQQSDLPFDILQPLIDETAAKIKSIPPRQAQTGPAQRGDEPIMEMQLNSLPTPELKEIYKLLSNSIIQLK